MRGTRRAKAPFAAVVTSDLVSTFGTEMTAVALPWFVLVTTGSAARMAGVMAAEFLGAAAFGIPAGRVAHLLGPRRALLAADALRGPLLVLIPALHWAGALSYVTLLLVGTVVGGCFPAYTSAQRMVVASVSGDDELRLTRLGGILGAVNETASFVGPATGGVLVALVGAPWVLVIDAATYAISFAVIATLVPKPPVQEPEVAARASDGVRYLWRSRPLRRQVGAILVIEMAFTALMATLPVAARHRYHGGAALAGAFLASYGAGSIAGGVASARLRRIGARRLGTSFVVMAALTWLLVPRLPAWAVAVGIAGFGVCNGIYFPRFFAALTLEPPAQLRSQVMTAAQTVMSTTGPLGFVAAGLLLQRGPLTPAFVLIAAATTIGAVVSVTGEPMRSRVDVEGAAAEETDEGEAGLLRELHRE